MRDALAYKLEPAGHEERPKRKYTTPSRKLVNAFEKWLDSSQNDEEWLPDRTYRRAEETLKGIDASIDEAHSLVMKNQDHPSITKAGYFLSCIYNKSPEKQIVYDLPVPLEGIGYRLPKNKSLVNKTHGSYNLGLQSAGVTLNYADYDCESSYNAFNSSGIFVNYGKNKGELGRNSQGYVINCGEFHGAFCPQATDLGISLEGIAILPSQKVSTVVLADFSPEEYTLRHGHREIGLTPFKYMSQRELQEYQKFLKTAEYQTSLKKVQNYLSEMKKEFDKGKTDYNAVFEALKKYPKEEVRKYLTGAITEAYKCKVKH